MNTPLPTSACTPANVGNPPAEREEPGSFDLQPESGGIYGALARMDASSSCVTETSSCALVPSGSSCVSGASAFTCRAVVPVSNSTGILPRMIVHDFLGHKAAFLDTKELTQVLGSVPHSLERPSLLNALAFRCRSHTCLEGQCTLHLDEINVLQLRQAWDMDCLAAGHDINSRKAAVLHTLAGHFDGEQKVWLRSAFSCES